ncbi:hypothetical protein RRG08_038057 [Elysia crispata]|uniref:Uncharacterized protein n=1 Tax=Elysia crispata TaxID=231223 RepID=A0AAE1DQA5_9GAST|nr:hypothetical protein RRG08_038057 [Elysia crispata]
MSHGNILVALQNCLKRCCKRNNGVFLDRRKFFAIVKGLLGEITGSWDPPRTRCASLSRAYPREFRPCFLQEEITRKGRATRRSRRTYRRFVCSSRVGFSLELFQMGSSAGKAGSSLHPLLLDVHPSTERKIKK